MQPHLSIIGHPSQSSQHSCHPVCLFACLSILILRRLRLICSSALSALFHSIISSSHCSLIAKVLSPRANRRPAAYCTFSVLTLSHSDSVTWYRIDSSEIPLQEHLALGALQSELRGYSHRPLKHCKPRCLSDDVSVIFNPYFWYSSFAQCLSSTKEILQNTKYKYTGLHWRHHKARHPSQDAKDRELGRMYGAL